jgi:hypothetical protein
MISHRIMGGKVYVYKREDSRFWQCSTHFKNRNYRHSTKEESLEHAKQIAEDWYADSDDFARSFRNHVARCSEMISLAVPT